MVLILLYQVTTPAVFAKIHYSTLVNQTIDTEKPLAPQYDQAFAKMKNNIPAQYNKTVDKLQVDLENFTSKCSTMSTIFVGSGFECDQAFAIASMFCDTKTPGKEMLMCSDPFIHDYLKSRNITNVEAFARHGIEATTLAQQKGSPGTDAIIMTVNLRPHEDPYLTKQGYYQVSTWYMNASKGSKVCPSGDCQYSIEKTQFNPNLYSVGGYVFEGLLKASVVSNDTTNSKFYPIHAEFDKTASQEKQGRTTEFLQGSIKIGKDINKPDFEYKVDNGTLLLDPSPHVLTLKGVRG